MGRFRAIISGDDLDKEVQGHVRTARRALENALVVCSKATRYVRTAADVGRNARYQARKAFKDMQLLHSGLASVRSTVPVTLEDPDRYPEPLKDQVREIEGQMEQARRHLRAARMNLQFAEDAFNEVSYTFAQEEISQIEKVEGDLQIILGGLNAYRGLRGLALSDRKNEKTVQTEKPKNAVSQAVPSMSEEYDG